MKQSFLLILFLALISLNAFNQEITVEIPNMTAPAIGQTIDVPLILTGAGENGLPISVTELRITYSTSVLTYVGLVSFSPLMPANTWVYNATGGAVLANWLEPTYTTAIPIPDGTSVFYMRFTYNGGSSNLEFTQNEFYDANYLLIPTIAVNGAVNAAVSDKTLNITNVMLEGLYAGGGTMNQANSESGQQFGAGVADVITVELHNDANYGTLDFPPFTAIELSTTGTATVTGIPAALNGNYYVTIKHRNSIEITSASPVSFAGNAINLSFATPANVYGGNLLLMSDLGYVIYGGDVNQDGYIDTGDGTDVDNDQFNFMGGYVVTDVNGDGFVDTADGTIIDNNQFNFAGSILP